MLLAAGVWSGDSNEVLFREAAVEENKRARGGPAGREEKNLRQRCERPKSAPGEGGGRSFFMCI